MLEIEILEAHETERAKKILLRDGLVAVKDILKGEKLKRIQNAATRVIQEIIDDDLERKGNRGHHRYSFGNQIHHIEWSELVDLPPIWSIAEAVWDLSLIHI